MKLSDANDGFSTLSDRFNSPHKVKKHVLTKESETGRSGSTSPSLTTNFRPVKFTVQAVRKTRPGPHTLIEPLEKLDRHSAVINSLNQTSLSMSKVRKQYKRRETSVSVDESRKLPEIEMNLKSNLYAKKNPPSLYNGSRNIKSFEHHTILQEVLHRISLIGNLADEVSPGTKKELTRPLKELFQYCVETESKTYYHVWFKLLQTFENLFKAFTRKPDRSKTEDIDENSEVVNDVDQLMNRDLDFENPKGETMAMIVKDLSKLWKSATHKITNKETFFALETIWNALVKLLNKSITVQSARITKAFESIQETSKLERTRHKRLIDLMAKNYEEKFSEISQENLQMKRTIERLIKDKEDMEEIVKDREIEIHALKQAPDTREFRKLVLETANYLDECEARQERQALILQDIGRMINVDFSDRVTRLKKVLQTTVEEVEIPSTNPNPEKSVKYYVNRATNTEIRPPPKKRHATIPPRIEEPRFASPSPDVKMVKSPEKTIEKPTEKPTEKKPAEKQVPFRRVEVVKAIANSVINILKASYKPNPQIVTSPVASLDTESTPSAFDRANANRNLRRLASFEREMSPAKIKSPVNQQLKEEPKVVVKEEPFEKKDISILKHTFNFEPSRVKSLDFPSPVAVARKPQTSEISVQTDADWVQPQAEPRLPAIITERYGSATIAPASSLTFGRRGSINFIRSLELGGIEQFEVPKPVSLLIEPLRTQYPMIEANIYKLIEASLEEKAKFDILDTEQGRPVRHMVECLLDFLYKQYGLKFLALKNFSSLIEGLQKNIERPYINLYCRLLCIFTKQPIGTMQGCFIVKARTAFVATQRNGRMRGANKTAIEYGGEASVSDIIDIIPKLFIFSDSARLAGEGVVRRLLLDKPLVEYLPSLITNKVLKLGLEFSSFYNKLDPLRQGYITLESLIEGVRNILDIWLPKKTLEDYFKGEFRTSNFTLSQLASKLFVKDPYAALQSKAAMITKCDFLTHIVDSIADIETMRLTEVKLIFEEFQVEELTRAQFTDAVRRLDPQMSDTKVTELFNANAFFPSETLSRDNWLALVKGNNLGGLQVISENDDSMEHDQIIDYVHSEGRLAVQFKRKNTKYLRKR
mmetsp:Transcript_32192/g.55617  ORF Transcript_32192/g.55617 Transcript_32192/m.55617 type:complete len:1105 (-) Transcript_32192:22-3336(-)